MSNLIDKERARKTLYVTGFNYKYTTKHLLEELFTQGGPVREVTLFDTHAYILFQHEESVPYCLALFNETELHGQKLRINPRLKSKDVYCYMKYLNAVRNKLMTEYMKIPPPDLPQKKMPEKKSPKSQEHNNIMKKHSIRKNNRSKSNNHVENVKRRNNRRTRGKIKKK